MGGVRRLRSRSGVLTSRWFIRAMLKAHVRKRGLGDIMLKKLVLVRHGKTEVASSTGRDIDRRLTSAGLRALEMEYPRTFQLLGQDPEVSIWCSPAVRALQTAGVVAEAVDACGIDIHDSLYEQDLDAFLGELSEAEPETLVAVGHVPFMEDLAERLCGARPDFGTGSVMAI